MTMTGRRLVVLDPTAEIEVAPGRRVVRSGDLSGQTVGLLDNGKGNADRFLELLGEELKQRYGVRATVLRRKPSSSRVVPAELAAELAAQCDLVVAAVGD